MQPTRPVSRVVPSKFLEAEKLRNKKGEETIAHNFALKAHISNPYQIMAVGFNILQNLDPGNRLAPYWDTLRLAALGKELMSKYGSTPAITSVYHGYYQNAHSVCALDVDITIGSNLFQALVRRVIVKFDLVFFELTTDMQYGGAYGRDKLVLPFLRNGIRALKIFMKSNGIIIVPNTRKSVSSSKVDSIPAAEEVGHLNSDIYDMKPLSFEEFNDILPAHCLSMHGGPDLVYDTLDPDYPFLQFTVRQEANL